MTTEVHDLEQKVKDLESKLKQRKAELKTAKAKREKAVNDEILVLLQKGVKEGYDTLKEMAASRVVEREKQAKARRSASAQKSASPGERAQAEVTLPDQTLRSVQPQSQAQPPNTPAFGSHVRSEQRSA